MKILLRLLAGLTIFLSILGGLTACGGDEPASGDGSQNNWNKPGSDKEPMQPDDRDISSLINKDVKYSVSYSGYICTVCIESILEDELPGRDIRYDIGLSDRTNESCVSISGATDKYFSTSRRQAGDKTIIEIQFPFYAYFMAMESLYGRYSGNSDYQNIYTTDQMYLVSWNAMRHQSSLTSEERDLLNEIEKTLGNDEREAKRNLKAYLLVYVDNRCYPPLPSFYPLN